jgi:hypothetical protein
MLKQQRGRTFSGIESVLPALGGGLPAMKLRTRFEVPITTLLETRHFYFALTSADQSMQISLR